MALTDPQSVTITGFNGGSAISLPRTEQSPFRSVYTSSDGLYELIVSHRSQGVRGRLDYKVESMIRLNVRVVTANPLESTKNVEMTASVWIVVSKPAAGFTATNYANMASSLWTLLSASTNLNLGKMIGNEH